MGDQGQDREYEAEFNARTLPEAPFSSNFTLISPRGVNVQFTIRARSGSEGLPLVNDAIDFLLDKAGYTVNGRTAPASTAPQASAAKPAPSAAPVASATAGSTTSEARKAKDFTGITRLLNDTGGHKFKLATLYNGQPDKNPFEVTKDRDIEVLLKVLAAADIDGLAFDIGKLYQVPGNVSWGSGPEIPNSNGKHYRSDMQFVIKQA